MSGGPGNRTGANPYVITFTGGRGHTDVPLLSTSAAGLTAAAGSTLFELPLGAYPTAWSPTTGHVVGVGADNLAWSWTLEGGLVQIPGIGSSYARPNDVNELGQVVGDFVNENGVMRPFVWSAAANMARYIFWRSASRVRSTPSSITTGA